MMETLYRDRYDAGRKLAELLSKYAGRSDVLVLALPRGGLPVAYEVARALSVPLDVFLVRKLGVPGHQELALGAIASGGTRVLNLDVIHTLHIPEQAIEEIAAREQRELERREQLYHADRPSLDVREKTVILIDDGLATGATMYAALRALGQQQPACLIVAVPVAAPSTCQELLGEADDVICARMPDPFFGVGLWYQDFEQISDQEVCDLLALAAEAQNIQSYQQSV
jgi:putative phosphoribosyl transferase